MLRPICGAHINVPNRTRARMCAANTFSAPVCRVVRAAPCAKSPDPAVAQALLPPCGALRSSGVPQALPNPPFPSQAHARPRARHCGAPARPRRGFHPALPWRQLRALRWGERWVPVAYVIFRATPGFQRPRGEPARAALCHAPLLTHRACSQTGALAATSPSRSARQTPMDCCTPSAITARRPLLSTSSRSRSLVASLCTTFRSAQPPSSRTLVGSVLFAMQAFHAFRAGTGVGDSEWHFVSIVHNTTVSWVTLDAETSVLAHPPGYTLLDATNQSFVGGVPDFSLTSASHIFTNSYFVGCIQDLFINPLPGDAPLSLTAAAASQAVTQGPCDNTDGCAPASCANGGSCADSFWSHTCSCVGFYTGPSCSESRIANYSASFSLCLQQASWPAWMAAASSASSGPPSSSPRSWDFPFTSAPPRRLACSPWLACRAGSTSSRQPCPAAILRRPSTPAPV